MGGGRIQAPRLREAVVSARPHESDDSPKPDSGSCNVQKTCFATLAAALAFGASANAQVNLTAETGPQGGVPHGAVTTLGELASQAGVANFQIAEGQTLTNSLQNVAQGKTDVAAVPLILPFLLSKGAGPYAKLGKKKGAELAANTAVLYTYLYGGYALYAYDSSPVKGWKDIKGKTIVNGPPRGAALSIARALVRLVTGYSDGKDYKGRQSNWGQMVKTITDGTGEAMVLPITFPDSRIVRSLGLGKHDRLVGADKGVELRGHAEISQGAGDRALGYRLEDCQAAKGADAGFGRRRLAQPGNGGRRHGPHVDGLRDCQGADQGGDFQREGLHDEGALYGQYGYRQHRPGEDRPVRTGAGEVPPRRGGGVGGSGPQDPRLREAVARTDRKGRGSPAALGFAAGNDRRDRPRNPARRRPGIR